MSGRARCVLGRRADETGGGVGRDRPGRPRAREQISPPSRARTGSRPRADEDNIPYRPLVCCMSAILVLGRWMGEVELGTGGGFRPPDGGPSTPSLVSPHPFQKLSGSPAGIALVLHSPWLQPPLSCTDQDLCPHRCVFGSVLISLVPPPCRSGAPKADLALCLPFPPSSFCPQLRRTS